MTGHTSHDLDAIAHANAKEAEEQFTEREIHDLVAIAKWFGAMPGDYKRYLVEKALGLICPNYEEVYEKMHSEPEETEVSCC